MNNELLYLILNSIAYLLLLYYSKKIQNKVWILFSTLWFLSSLFSVFFSFLPLTFSGYDQKSYPVTIMPFLYLFTLFFLGILPFKFFNNKTLVKKRISYQPELFKFIVVLLALISVEPLIETVIRIFSYGIGNLANVYTSDRFTAGFSTRGYFSVFGFYLFSITDYFKYLSTTFLFVYLIKGGKNKYIIIGLFFAILNPIMNGLANGQRSLVLNVGMQFLFMYILLYTSMKPELRKKIAKYAIIAISTISVLFISISISRFGQNDDQEYGTLFSIILYEGESFYMFNTEAYHVEKYLDGRSVLQTFYSYFYNIGRDSDVIEYYNWKTGILTNIFYTYIGVFVMDYGLVKAFIILMLLALIFIFISKSAVRAKNLNLGTLILMSLYSNIFLFGTTYWVYQNTFIHLLFTIFVALIFIVTSKNISK